MKMAPPKPTSIGNETVKTQMAHLRPVRFAAACAAVLFAAALVPGELGGAPPAAAWVLAALAAWGFPVFSATRGAVLLDPRWDSDNPHPGSPETLAPWQRNLIPWGMAARFSLPPLFGLLGLAALQLAGHQGGLRLLGFHTSALLSLLFLAVAYLFQRPFQAWTKSTSRSEQTQLALLLLGLASLLHLALFASMRLGQPTPDLRLSLVPAFLALLAYEFLGFRARRMTLSPQTRILAMLATLGATLLALFFVWLFASPLGASATAVLLFSPASPLTALVAAGIFLLLGTRIPPKATEALSRTSVGILVLHPMASFLLWPLVAGLEPNLGVLLLAFGSLGLSTLVALLGLRIPYLRRLLG